MSFSCEDLLNEMKIMKDFIPKFEELNSKKGNIFRGFCEVEKLNILS